jgi:hypothetical protein
MLGCLVPTMAPGDANAFNSSEKSEEEKDVSSAYAMIL